MKKSNLHDLIIIFLLVVTFIASIVLTTIDNRTTGVEKKIDSVQIALEDFTKE